MDLKKCMQKQGRDLVSVLLSGPSLLEMKFYMKFFP